MSKKRKTIKNKLTKLWSEIVRKYGVCEVCEFKGEPTTGKLDAHHIEGKKSDYMRFLLLNGISLCFNHHRNGIHSTSYSDQERTSILIKRVRGAGVLRELESLKFQPPKMSLSDLEDLLIEFKQKLND